MYSWLNVSSSAQPDLMKSKYCCSSISWRSSPAGSFAWSLARKPSLRASSSVTWWKLNFFGLPALISSMSFWKNESLPRGVEKISNLPPHVMPGYAIA